VEDGALFIISTSKIDSSSRAAVRIAVEMVNDKVVSERDALLTIDIDKISYFDHHPIIPHSASAISAISKGFQLFCVFIWFLLIEYNVVLENNESPILIGKGLSMVEGYAVSGRVLISRFANLKFNCDRKYILCMDLDTFTEEDAIFLQV
jgi:hypothetical protein